MDQNTAGFSDVRREITPGTVSTALCITLIFYKSTLLGLGESGSDKTRDDCGTEIITLLATRRCTLP